MDDRSRYIGLLVSGVVAVVTAIAISALSAGGMQPPPSLTGLCGTALGIFGTLLQVPTYRDRDR